MPENSRSANKIIFETLRYATLPRCLKACHNHLVSELEKLMRNEYDAILFVSFGGPEGMSDVIPFLENVLRGRNVPPERMKAVAHHYELFDGVSPINEQNRKLIAALTEELATSEIALPIYWGNRNWHPLLTDTLEKMSEDGIKNALAFVTSAYSSYSGCRQYRENIEAAKKTLKVAPTVDKLRVFFNHPGFVEANSERIIEAQKFFEKNKTDGKNVHVAFTAHSIPTSMSSNCDYVQQLNETAKLVAEHAGITQWTLCFQSRSGPATQPWLEPDICDFIKEFHSNGGKDLIIAPIGFISDHMEVIYDLDTEANALCTEIGVNMRRAGTAGTHPAFVRMIRQLIEERLDDSTPRQALGCFGPRADACADNCCPVGVRPAAAERAG